MKKIGNKSAIMAAIESLHNTEIHEGEFTIKEFMELAAQHRRKISRKTASDHLQRLVDNGSMQMRKVCLNGKMANVYREK